MAENTLTVSQLLGTLEGAVAEAIPGPVWVRGEVTGFKRTSGGAAFFRLADAEVDNTAIDVSARGRVMFTIERQLEGAGLGSLRDGVEIRIRGTVGVDRRQSLIRLSLLEVDPAFTAGRLAIERAAVLERMTADGSLAANARLELPLVPLRVGLVTSRGSAAHADFIEHLRSSGFRFSVKTAHTAVQGETAPDEVARAIERVAAEPVDVIALIRGGGSKLDLSVFDSEIVGRAIAAAPVPVVTGIGHEVDRSVADEAAAIYQKTPTAAGEWLASIVQQFADRIAGARQHIGMQAHASIERAGTHLKEIASTLTGARSLIGRQVDLLDHLGSNIAGQARNTLETQRRRIESLADWFSTIGVDRTLGRGFALVTDSDGRTVIRSVDQVSEGDRLLVRVADGTVQVIVNEK